eukprot:2825523-Pleurochrysis_carterae.AAC.1
MPNLGAMQQGDEAAAPQPDAATTAASGGGDGGGGGGAARRGAVLADLPGLVEGAHLGKGLGRQFLQQLRRVRVVLYVLDAVRILEADGS